MSLRRASRLDWPAGSLNAAMASSTLPPAGSASRAISAPSLAEGTRRVAEAGVDGIGRAHDLAGQAEVDARLARRVRQQPGAADVGDQADAGLRHGELRALGDDAVARVAGQADAAAHDDAVLDGDERLGIAADQRVEPVLVAPERARQRRALRAAVVQAAHVAAGAQAALAGAVEHHQLDGRIVLARQRSASQIRPTIGSVSALSAFGRFMVMRPGPALAADQDLVSCRLFHVLSLTFLGAVGISRPERPRRNRFMALHGKGRYNSPMTIWQKTFRVCDRGRRGGRHAAGRAGPVARARTGTMPSRRSTSPSPSPSSRSAPRWPRRTASSPAWRWRPSGACSTSRPRMPATSSASIDLAQAGHGRLRGLCRPDRRRCSRTTGSCCSTCWRA